MKRRLYTVVALAIIGMAMWNMSLGSQADGMQDIKLANIDALASDETGKQPMNCWSDIDYKNDGRPVSDKTYCGDCEATPCTHWWNEYRCMR